MRVVLRADGRVEDPRPDPPDDVKAMLHAKLAAVMAELFEDAHVVDDNMRTIPTHYHAHARPKTWGRGFRRRHARGA